MHHIYSTFPLVERLGGKGIGWGLATRSATVLGFDPQNIEFANLKKTAFFRPDSVPQCSKTSFLGLEASSVPPSNQPLTSP